MYIFVLQQIELQKAVLSELHRIVLILTAMCCTELDCAEVTNALLCNTVQNWMHCRIGCSVDWVAGLSEPRKPVTYTSIQEELRCKKYISRLELKSRIF